MDKWCENVLKLIHVRHTIIVEVTNLDTEGDDVYEIYHHWQEHRSYRGAQECC